MTRAIRSHRNPPHGRDDVGEHLAEVANGTGAAVSGSHAAISATPTRIARHRRVGADLDAGRRAPRRRGRRGAAARRAWRSSLDRPETHLDRGVPPSRSRTASGGSGRRRGGRSATRAWRPRTRRAPSDRRCPRVDLITGEVDDRRGDRGDADHQVAGRGRDPERRAHQQVHGRDIDGSRRPRRAARTSPRRTPTRMPPARGAVDADPTRRSVSDASGGTTSDSGAGGDGGSPEPVPPPPLAAARRPARAMETPLRQEDREQPRKEPFVDGERDQPARQRPDRCEQREIARDAGSRCGPGGIRRRPPTT